MMSIATKKAQGASLPYSNIVMNQFVILGLAFMLLQTASHIVKYCHNVTQLPSVGEGCRQKKSLLLPLIYRWHECVYQIKRAHTHT